MSVLPTCPYIKLKLVETIIGVTFDFRYAADVGNCHSYKEEYYKKLHEKE